MGGGRARTENMPSDYPNRSQSATPTVGMGAKKAMMSGAKSPPPRRAASRIDTNVRFPRIPQSGSMGQGMFKETAFKDTSKVADVDDVGVDQRMQKIVREHEADVSNLQREYNQLHTRWVEAARRLAHLQNRVEEEKLGGALSDSEDEDGGSESSFRLGQEPKLEMDTQEVAQMALKSHEVRHNVSVGQLVSESEYDFRERLRGAVEEALINTGLIRVEQRTREIIFNRVKPEMEEARRISNGLREARDTYNHELDKMDIELVKGKESEHVMLTHLAAEREAVRMKRQLWEKKRLVLLKMAATGTMTPEYKKALEIRQKLWRRSLKTLLGGSKSPWYKEVMEDIKGVTAEIKTVRVKGPRRKEIKAVAHQSSDGEEEAHGEVIDEASDEEGSHNGDENPQTLENPEGEMVDGFAPKLYEEIANTEAHKWLERDMFKRRQHKERILKKKIGTEVKRTLIDQEKSDYDREYEQLEEFFEMVRQNTGLGYEECNTIADIVHPKSQKRVQLEGLVSESQKRLEQAEVNLKEYGASYEDLMAFGTMTKQFRDDMDRGETEIITAEGKMFVSKRRCDEGLIRLKNIEFGLEGLRTMLETMGVMDVEELHHQNEKNKGAHGNRRRKVGDEFDDAASNVDSVAPSEAAGGAAAAAGHGHKPHAGGEAAAAAAGGAIKAPAGHNPDPNVAHTPQLVQRSVTRRDAEESEAAEAVEQFGITLEANLLDVGDTLDALLKYLKGNLPESQFIPELSEKSLSNAMSLAEAVEELDQVVEVKNQNKNVRVLEKKKGLTQAEMVRAKVLDDLDLDTGDGDDDYPYLGERLTVKDFNHKEIERIERLRLIQEEQANAKPHEGRMTLLDRQASRTRGAGSPSATHTPKARDRGGKRLARGGTEAGSPMPHAGGSGGAPPRSPALSRASGAGAGGSGQSAAGGGGPRMMRSGTTVPRRAPKGR